MYGFGNMILFLVQREGGYDMRFQMRAAFFTGSRRVLACCGLIVGGSLAAIGDVPSVGQHTDQVLSDIGFSGERIAAMRAAGAV